ncbi:MAG: metallophosphoesterase family protein [Bacillota bacterium]
MGKRVAFISDIHGNMEALEAVIRDIETKGIALSDVYCLGDLVGYGPRPNEVIAYIQDHQIQCILGNYDEAVGFFLPSCGCSIESETDKIRAQNSLEWTSMHTTEENKWFLRNLDEQVVIEEEGFKLLLTHGSSYSINDYVYEEDTEKQEEIAEEIEEDIMVFGHTHFPYIKKVHNKILINVGSVGRPKDGDCRACYCILDIKKDINVEFVRVPYDVERVAKEIEQSGLLDVFATILRIGKDVIE